MSKKIKDFTLRDNPNNLHIVGYDPNTPQEEIRIPANKLIASANIAEFNSAISIHNSSSTAHPDIEIRMENYATTSSINDLFGNANSMLDYINGKIILK